MSNYFATYGAPSYASEYGFGSRIRSQMFLECRNFGAVPYSGNLKNEFGP